MHGYNSGKWMRGTPVDEGAERLPVHSGKVDQRPTTYNIILTETLHGIFCVALWFFLRGRSLVGVHFLQRVVPIW